MINKLTLKNFKSFKELSLDIKPITILVGPNSSGKSSIIKALGLLHQSYVDGKPNSLISYRGKIGDFGNYETLVHQGINEPFEIKFSSNIEIVLDKDNPNGVEYQGLSDPIMDFSLSVYKGTEKISVTLNGKSYCIESNPRSRKEGNNISPILSDDTGDLASIYNYGIAISQLSENEDAKWDDFSLNFEEHYQKGLHQSLAHLQFLAPLRPQPQRRYERKELEEYLITNTDGELTIDKINKYLELLGISDRLKLTEYSSKDLKESIYSLLLQSENSHNCNIVDVGFGISQLLPILIALLQPNKSIIVQEPELHLHPNVQAKFAEAIASAINNIFLFGPPKFILLETHSEHLIRGFQVLVAQGKLKPEDIAVYYVDKINGVSSVNELPIDEHGFFTKEWPDGFMDVSAKQTLEFFKARQE